MLLAANVRLLSLPFLRWLIKGIFSPSQADSRVVVLTDLHAGEMLVGSRWLKARVDQAQALKPDLIVLVGDLFERGSDPAELTPIMQHLQAPLGVWAVRGNHDSLRTGRRDVAGEILAGAGIRLRIEPADPPAQGKRKTDDQRKD